MLAAALVAVVAALVFAPAVRAAEFLVNSTADKAKAAPGVKCVEGEVEECTLRAAIETGEAFEEFFRIDFDEEVFEGHSGATIALGSSLPPVTFPAFINGRVCETEAGVGGPCVGISGPGPGEPALIVRNAEEVEIAGLAITGAQTAIAVEASPRTKVQGSWLGVTLDGASTGNGTGVLVDPGSNRVLIGGENAEQGDVFAGNADDGLDIHGGSESRVFGNYFGVEPDGTTPSANGGDDIEVVSTEGSEVTGTTIGARLSSTAALSPKCDGTCNVISGAASDGVDLEGEGEEAPAISTSVLGNYIGLTADGTGAVPNDGVGVDVGEAAHARVGGPAGTEANRISGGSAAVMAGPAAPDLAIRGNLIGSDASGTGTLEPPDSGIVVDSAALSSPAVEAEITGNLIRMEGGVAIAQRGQGAWIFANQISGADVGVRTTESSEYGNVIEANSIEGPAISGILVENNFNEIVGNAILGAGGPGVWIQGSFVPFGVSGNVIGGDMASDANFIANSGGPAIEISDLEKTQNEVARNEGVANAGLFIDLVAASPGKGNPNRGIEPPVLSTATQAEVSGTALPGATVRVFRKQVAAVGELGSFLGGATADEAGNWSLSYENAIPAGSIAAATQTSEGSTSELATAVVPPAGGSAGVDDEGTALGVGAKTDSFRPRTKIVRGPRKRSRSAKARFAFLSDEVGATFQCQLDGRPFAACKSPQAYAGLRPGEHVFRVRAVDRAGNVDASPAKKKFTVIG